MHQGCSPFLKNFGWKYVNASHLILKAKVTTLLPFGLVSLLYSVAVLLPLGINHLPNTEAGLSSACHAGSVPSEIGSCSSESPFKCYSGHSACDSVGQAYMLSYTEVRLRAQASLRCLPSQRAVLSVRGNPITWG